MFYRVHLKALNKKKKIIYRIVLNKVLSKGNSVQQEVLGFYDMDTFRKRLVINSYRLGYWMNRGALLNNKVYKVLRKYLAKY